MYFWILFPENAVVLVPHFGSCFQDSPKSDKVVFAWIIKGCSFTLILFFCIFYSLLRHLWCKLWLSPGINICYTLDICFFKKAMNDKFILKKSFSDRKIVALNHLLVLSPYIHLQDSSCLEKIRKRENQKWKLKGTLISLQFSLSSKSGFIW